ncbi:type II toxin-antitoxin system RelE/ParE family toxin [Enterobacter sp.]|uniref:type II toxin-antitoxin system RelE/ParE family toxin n=1 Tax=Enterobacter sp. TaxID=42895 RepID=UPI00296EC2E3|nr:type II toxin-antitoxin system RelE/ParE family toxin [Enterobacter sp.]
MGTFTLTDDAKEDLKEVKAYSLQHWNSAITRVYLQGMRNTMQIVADNDMGIDISAETWPGILCWPYERHSFFFVRVKGGIQVIGILHQSRLPKALLKRRPA